MQESQTKLLEVLNKFEAHENLPIYEELVKLNKNMEALVNKTEAEAPEIQKIEIEGAEIVTIKGKPGNDGGPGKDGVTPSREALLNLIRPLIPEPVKGDDGYTPIKGKDYFDGKNGVSPDIETVAYEASKMTEERIRPFIPKIEDIEKDLPRLGKEIRDSLELLQGEDRLDVSSIKGIDELKKEIISETPKMVGGGRSSHATQIYPLTPDGSTKTFSVPKNVSGLVFSSDNLPTPLMENFGYTINATRTQIVLTVENAPTLGSQLVFLYQSVFNTA